jgi:excisionase family DNA binding protein
VDSAQHGVSFISSVVTVQEKLMPSDAIDHLENKENLAHLEATRQRIVSAMLSSSAPRIAILKDSDSNIDEATIFELPPTALRLFADMLGLLGQGHAVSIVQRDRYMSTQEAAMVLNVSRPYLVRMLDDRKLPYHKVGTHRRLKFEDVVAYREQRHNISQAALQELAEQGQETG